MASLVKREFKSTKVYYIQYWQGGKQKRRRAHESYGIANQMLRDFENAQARGEETPLPTRTPIAEIVAAYVAHIHEIKTDKSAQTDIYYLRDLFGPICKALEVNSRKRSTKVKKRKPKLPVDGRKKAPAIEADCFEKITTKQVSEFIEAQKAGRNLAAKTANRYREILQRLFNWAMEERGIKTPGDRNPVAKVSRYKQPASKISFLTLDQIQAQLGVLGDDLKLQCMVATLIYAGVRREELLWLTHDDLDLKAGKHGMIRVRAKTIDDETWQPKTDGSTRAVPVSRQLRPFLDKWRLKHRKGTWLFPNSMGGRYDPDNFSRDLRIANTAANLIWACLEFRHTFGSMLAQRGISLYHISALMGNSPEICRRHYAALIPEALVDSVEFEAPPASKTPDVSTTASA